MPVAMPDPLPAAERLEKRLGKALARAVTGFHMLRDGDRVLVAVSGGKDSIGMLHLLAGLSRRAPIRFGLLAVHLDQGQPGHDPEPLADWMRDQGHEFHIVRDDTWSIVKQKTPEGGTYCSMCSRLRRAVLYRVAGELGCTRIALGHHRDDAIVTLLMNLIFSGQLKSMPPKLVSDDGKHVVIRPLIYCAERDLAALAAELRFPILPCNICGTQPDQQRKLVDGLLTELERKNPGVKASMLAALANVRASHLLDPGLWKKLDLAVARDDDPPDPVLPLDRLVRS
jgi:tRNA 2-thiocytidine biosynthesis protein TtcA